LAGSAHRLRLVDDSIVSFHHRHLPARCVSARRPLFGDTLIP
jgi:hypothetical protein